MSTPASKPQSQLIPNRGWIIAFTILFGIASASLFYIIVSIWPSGYTSSKDPFYLLGKQYFISAEHRLMVLMILGGALGANIHLIMSFTAFVGSRTFSRSWIPWYLLRPVIGSGMALFFYLVLRGGILTYSPSVAADPAVAAAGTQKEATQKDQRDNIPLNPYGMMAIACLAGLYSREAAEKLEEVFKALFNVKEKLRYKDSLPTVVTVTSVEPETTSNEEEDDEEKDAPR